MKGSPLRFGPLMLSVLLSLVLSAPTRALDGWGVEVGRATGGDRAQLLVDQLALKMAQNRITSAMQNPTTNGKMKALLDSPFVKPNVADLFDAVRVWWLKDVMGPAEAIAENPAASCAESQAALQTLLTMMRNRALIGMSPEENDHTPRAERIRKDEEQLTQMVSTIQTKMFNRCREEALDECVATGRYVQIPQIALAQERQLQLLGSSSGDMDAWIKKSLKQCAIYELHFVSSAKIEENFHLETVLDGKITLRYDDAKSPALKLEGASTGSSNPFLVSVKCEQRGAQVTCSPGGDPSPSKAEIKGEDMDLRHTEYYVDANGISRSRIAGDDKLKFDFSVSMFNLQAVFKIPNGGDMTLPFPAGGIPFCIAHNKDRQGDGTMVKIENNKRGAYPVIFEFTYADQGTESKVTAADSTVIQLIHKPEPEPYKHAPDPTRKPLKPHGI